MCSVVCNTNCAYIYPVVHCSDRYVHADGLGTSVSEAVCGGVEGSNCSVQMT